MNKEKVRPRKPPLKDLQGHTYQHEVGDPDWAAAATRKLGLKSDRKPERVGAGDRPETQHDLADQKDRAKAGEPAHIKLPRNSRKKSR
jgi:hypothetical protein